MNNGIEYPDFPFSIDGRGGTAFTGEANHVRDMIEQLLFTRAGERVNRPDFGSGLLQLVHEPNSRGLEATLQFSVEAALQRYLGDVIELRALEVTGEDAILRVVVQYILRRTGEARTDTFDRSGP
jgi:uncharacterized protein